MIIILLTMGINYSWLVVEPCPSENMISSIRMIIPNRLEK